MRATGDINKETESKILDFMKIYDRNCIDLILSIKNKTDIPIQKNYDHSKNDTPCKKLNNKND